jgi:hypothetical protein
MNFLKRLFLFAFFTATVLPGITQFTKPAAAAVDNVVSSVYQDSNNDGTVDRIRWVSDGTITACVYDAADWTVNTAGSMNVSITGLSCSGSDSNLYILVSADTHETGGTTSPVISYANAGTSDSVMVGASGMGGHASQTATDNAAPVVYAATWGQTDCGTGNRNVASITYSETVQVSADGGSVFGSSVTSSATLGAMTTARTLAGIGSWASLNGGDMASNTATANVVNANPGGLMIICFNYTPTSYYSSGTIAPTTPVFTPVADVTAVKDLVGLAVNTSASAPSATVTLAWDVTKPTIANTYSCDTDIDGYIDVIQVNASENMLDSALTGSYFDGDENDTDDGMGEHVAGSVSTSTLGCDGLTNDTDVNDEKFRIQFGFGDNVPGTAAAYLNVNTGSVVRDMVGNIVAPGSSLGTEHDKAGPVLLSSSPADSGSVSRTGNVTLTFSEAVASLSASVAPTSVTLTPTGTPGASVTLTHATPFAIGTNTITIATAPDADANVFAGAASTAAHPFTFTATTGTSAGTGYIPPTSYTVSFTSSYAGLVLTPGNKKEITWTSTGSAIAYVSLYYSLDGGTTYKTIVTDTENDGSYEWTIPNESSETVTLYVTGTDLYSVLANDSSEIFKINGTAVVVPDDEEVEAPSTGTKGVSPFNGKEEDISKVQAGDVIKGLSYSTVYLIDSALVRHPFMDAQTYFSYYPNFTSVTTVTDATLPTLTLGSPMLPKPGVQLVKIQSDNKVFAVFASADGKTELRHVTSESLAVSMYGQSWSDYVIDVPSTLFPKFTIGLPIESAVTVDRAIMKTRFALSVENPSADNDGDGISNADEARIGTSMNDADTDNDGFPDGLEVGKGHDPLTAADSDGDGYPDYLEILHGYDPHKGGGAKL